MSAKNVPSWVSLEHIATLLIVVIVVIVGGIVVVIRPETLAFDQYIKDVGIAAGLLGIGRGIANAGLGR